MDEETAAAPPRPQSQAQSSLLSLKDVPFLILAGGKGTRLGEMSRDKPKSMVDISGEPFIAHVLRLLQREGVTRLVLLVHHFSEQIEEYLGDGSKFSMSIAYSRDGQDNFGTGSAVEKALDMVDNDFAVMYGDTYLDISMPPLFTAFKASRLGGMMSILENNNQWAPSNVEFDEESRLVLKYDKKDPSDNMHFIDYGLSFFSKSAFMQHSKKLKKTSFDLSDIFKSMAKKKELAGFSVNKRFYDINTVENFVETRAYLSQNNLW